MKKIQSIFFLFFLLLLIPACSSKPPPYPILPDITEVGENAPVDPEVKARNIEELKKIAQEPFPPYFLNAGDIYTVKVYDNPELEMQDTVVTPDGYLNIGLVGPVKVANLSIEEATRSIQKRLEEYVKSPKVILVPRIINSQMATLAGKVFKSGRFAVDGNMRLADLIALGQGLPNALNDGRQMELSDLQTSIFIRNGRILPIDFNLAIRGNPLHNIRIHTGDYIFIATRADKQISVIGEVNNPKYVIWYENIGIIEALANAGGLKDEHSANFLVIRGGMVNPKVYRVNINHVLSGKRHNPGLQPGDILYIPKDGISEYNVFIRKLMPTAQLINMLLTPGAFILGGW